MVFHENFVALTSFLGSVWYGGKMEVKEVHEYVSLAKLY